MPFILRIQRKIRSSLKYFLFGVLTLVALQVYLALAHQASVQSNARKSERALKFEKQPEEWLLHPKDVSQFRADLAHGKVSEVAQSSSTPSLVLYTLKDGSAWSVRIPNCTPFSCQGTVLDSLETESAKQGFELLRADIDPRGPAQKTLDVLSMLATPLLSLLSMVIAVIIMMRIQMGTGSTAAKLAIRPNISFEDVIGNQEAKANLQRVAAFLKDPKQYHAVGAKPPRGVLLVGPPGTGKTLLAKALAGQTKSNFIEVDGSYFTSMFFGAGVTKVRQLFELARKNAPCVLFIDEIDGIGKRTRSAEMRGADSESNRIINRVLVEMDGFQDMEGVVVVGATKHESKVDEALRRPGRFDAVARLTLPLIGEREALFKLYLGKLRGSALDCTAYARMTAGASPADIANLVNKAASKAAENGLVEINHTHVVQAIETYRMGGEVSAVKDLLTEETRKRLAYHEAGHALVAHYLGVGVVEHLTIEPRGEALGVTYVTRDTEEPLFGQTELCARLAMMLAGREAELIKLHNVSSGASDDLKRATELAINMAGNLGFSEDFGLLSLAGIPPDMLGDHVRDQALSAARKLLASAQRDCNTVLRGQDNVLEALSHALLEKEVVSGQELQQLLAGPSPRVPTRTE